jgi:undecaprenyl-diphosphatase
MLEIIQAIVYGVIQGITEFLPISSTAHLRVIPTLFGWQDIGAAYTAVIQIGTIIAVFVYFRKDIWELIKGFFGAFKSKNFLSDSYARLAIIIIIGTIPISVLGVILKKFIEGGARGLYVIAIVAIVMAILLWISEKIGKREKGFEEITLSKGFFIGCMQAIALIPGTSRSGITITAGLFAGIQRDAAARFSFLLSIPAVTLSGFYELYQERENLIGQSKLSLIIATAVSGIVGYYCIKYFISFLKTKSNMVFVVYRIILGIVILGLLYFGVLHNMDGIH